MLPRAPARACGCIIDGTVHVVARAPRRAAELGRRHTNHGVLLGVEADRPANHGWICGEPSAPESMADDGHWMGARRSILLGQKEPPQCRPHVEHVEVIAGHDLPDESLALLSVVEAERPLKEPRQARQHVVSVAEIDEHRIRHDCSFALLVDERDELLRAIHWQRAHQDLVQEAEDGRVGADPERQCEHGDQRKARALPQHAQAEPYVLDHVILQSAPL